MFLFALLGLLGAAQATPLQPTFSSCLSSYSPVASTSSRLDVQSVFANLVSGDESYRLGLQGGDVPTLRIDLVGVTGERIEGYDNETNKLATLFTDTRTASLNVFSSTTWLCNSLFPAQLPEPYSPYNVTYCPLPAGPFAINISIPLYKSYALTTLRTQIRIVDTAETANTLSCVDIQFTPYDHKGWYYRLFLWVLVAIAIGFWVVSWGARFAAGWVVGSGVAQYEQKDSMGVRVEGVKKEARMRKWGTMIISSLSGERLTVSGGLLRFVTPGVTEILHHIQYCTILSMIAVSWPQFAYPIFAQGAWADLVWNTTLVQGNDPISKRIYTYPNNYTAPSNFASQMNDAQYPLYLDPNSFNPLFDLYGQASGMESLAFAVGLRPQDLFGTCLGVFLLLAAGIILISLMLWALHCLLELFSKPAKPVRPNLGPSPRQSYGPKDIYDGRSGSLWDTEAPPSLPSQHSIPINTRPTQSRRILWRFRPKGEAGVFHTAALYGNLLRLILVFHLPVTTFSVYQLTLTQASIVSRVFAGLSFVFISILVPAGVVLKMKRTASGKLYDATRTLLALGPMYNVYVEDKQMYRVFPLVASLVTGIVVGAGQASGLAQSVILVLVELAMLVVPAVWYPWGEGASMGAPNSFLAAIRVASSVLVMLLSPQLAMTTFTNQWIAYAILILQAIVFLFFLLMLITKLVEGIIRLVGGVHFDESTHPLDGGLFGAIADLDCLNPGRGGKAAQRKRRKRGSRQLQRNVSAAGSLTTQMMLDRHSQGVMRPVSEGNTPFLMTGGAGSTGLDNRTSYFPTYAPPLGPPPLERHSSESRSEEPHLGNIMDAWKPAEAPALGPGMMASPQEPGGSQARRVSITPPVHPTESPTRSFSVVRGGRADANNPYTVQGPGRSPTSPIAYPPTSFGDPRASTSPPPIRISQAGQVMPTHTRQQSSHAVIERLDSRTSPPSTPMTGLYPPGRQQQGMRPNNQGLAPPILAIPTRRSLNNLRDESPSSDVDKGKDKKKKRSSFWGKSEKRVDDTESDDEPGPSSRRGSAQSAIGGGGRGRRGSTLSPTGWREPAPFEPVPLAVPDPSEEEGTSNRRGRKWKGMLGLGRKKSIDDVAEQIRDENKARKAALATESGSMLVGVTATPPEKRSFVVKRGGTGSPSPAGTPGSGRMTASPIPGQASSSRSSFAVKRVAQSIVSPTVAPSAPVASTPSLDSTSRTRDAMSASGGGAGGAGWSEFGQGAGAQHRPISGSGSGSLTGAAEGAGAGTGAGTGTVRSFRVLRPNSSSSPNGNTFPTAHVDNLSNGFSPSQAQASSTPSPSSSFVVHRHPRPTSQQQQQQQASFATPTPNSSAAGGYEIVPLQAVSSVSRTSLDVPSPDRPMRNPTRPSAEMER